MKYTSNLPTLLITIAVTVMALNLTGCNKYRTNLEPTMTTYPRDPQNINVSYSLIGFEHNGHMEILNDYVKSKYKGTDEFSYETNITKIGDDATIEIFIHNPKNTNASRRQLMNIAVQRGKDICRGKFAILETTYFYGDEATPGFYGLSNIKSLRTLYRCELKFSNSELIDYKDILHLSQQLVWPNFFDIIEYNFHVNAEKLFKDLSFAAKEHGINEVSSGKLGENRYYFLGSGDMNNKSAYRRTEQLAAIIEPIDDGSRVQIIFPALCFQKFRTSVNMIRHIPDKKGALVPWERDVAYNRARYFLSTLERITKLKGSEN